VVTKSYVPSRGEPISIGIQQLLCKSLAQRFWRGSFRLKRHIGDVNRATLGRLKRSPHLLVAVESDGYCVQARRHLYPRWRRLSCRLPIHKDLCALGSRL
jgi:hypothetical protein